VNLLGPATGYTDILNHLTTEKLTEDDASGKSYQKTPIRPSAAGKCARELFYELMQYSGKAKYPTEIYTPDTHRLLNLGHSVEYHVVKEFQLLSELFEIKYKQQVLDFGPIFANDPKLQQRLEGSLDLVFWSDKYKCVADVKSKKDKFSAFYKTNWDETTEKLKAMKTVGTISNTAFWVEDLDAFLLELNDAFFEANFRQLNLYANSDFLVQRGINHGAIIQYNKNDSRMREVRFKPSRTLYEKTVQRFQNVVTAVDTGNIELAPREYQLGSVKCAFCKFKNECWEGADAQKEFFNTLPKKSWPKDTSHLGKDGQALEQLFEMFGEQSQAELDKDVTEGAIVKVLLERQIHKVRLANGSIYELKRLKDGVKVRRGKL
jgi:hypothetical protein